MKTFNNTEKGYSKQRAMAYIVYMMAGSYFNSQGSTDRFKNLFLHYAEMPREKQYEWESRVINSMEGLNKDFLQKIAALRYEVFFTTCDEELLMEFRTGGFESLLCRIRKNGTFQLTPCRG